MPSKIVSCQLCGQGFGSASIGIHVPQCYDKALKRWQADPRGPKPVLPTRGPGSVGGTSKMAGATVGGSTLRRYQNDPPEQHGGVPLRAPLTQQQQQLYMPAEEAPRNLNLHPCRKCGRSFAFDRIAYHESVCAETKKRRQFNSKKQRLSDFDEFELRAAAGGGAGGGSMHGSRRTVGKTKISMAPNAAAAGGGSRPSGATSWRKQHSDFISAIRSAKQYQSKSAASRPPPDNRRGAPSNMRQPRQPYSTGALRNPEMFRASAARAGQHAGALGPRQVPQFPSSTPPSRTPAGSGRGAVSSVRASNALGGPSSAGSYGGAAPSYRIQNTNLTSKAMLEALGRY